MFEAFEEEQLVLHDRPARPLAAVGRVERARVERLPGGLFADERLVAEPVIHRAGDRVGSTPGDRVDARADEVALTHVERCDAHLHLLDRLQRNRRHVGSVARLPGEAEGVVEVRAVDRDVVHPVVLAREGPRAPVLRRQARHVVDPPRDGWQRRQLFPEHGCRGAGVRGAEHRVAQAHDGDRFGNRGHLQFELEVGRRAEADGDVLLHLVAEPGEGRRHLVRPADSHAGKVEATIALAHRLVGRPRRLMDRRHAGAGHHLPLRVQDHPGDGAGRHALRVRGTMRRQESDEDQQTERPGSHATHVCSMVRGSVWP